MTIKLIMGVNLLNYARRRSAGNAMERRVREDEEVNSFGRPPIGEGKAEEVSADPTGFISVIAPSICAHSYGGPVAGWDCGNSDELRRSELAAALSISGGAVYHGLLAFNRFARFRPVRCRFREDSPGGNFFFTLPRSSCASSSDEFGEFVQGYSRIFSSHPIR